MNTFNVGLIKLTETLHTTNSTLSKWVELQPTIERTKNNYTAIDTIKAWIGSLAVFYVLYDIVKKTLGL